MNPISPLHIVHTEASCGWGGQEIRILTEAAGMIARGHRVTLLCPQQAPLFSEATRRNIPVVALPIGRKNLKGLFAMHQWLKANPVNVINSHSSTDTWLVALASRFLADAPPLVRTRHISAPIPDNRPTRWLYTRASAHIITTGEKLRQTLIRDNGYDPDHITSIPTGIDPVHFTPGDKQATRRQLGLAPDGMIIGIVATLRSWKGHDYLLEAFSRIADTNARLMIIGDGPQQQHLQELIETLHITERVIMPGNQREVLPWLQAMDLFVLPSYANEGVPQSILQAMLCGLPIISTPVGSITEAIEHERTGLLVEPKNAAALEQAISRLLEHDGLRRQLATAARHHAEAHFTFDRMVQRMEAIFRQVAH